MDYTYHAFTKTFNMLEKRLEFLRARINLTVKTNKEKINFSEKIMLEFYYLINKLIYSAVFLFSGRIDEGRIQMLRRLIPILAGYGL